MNTKEGQALGAWLAVVQSKVVLAERISEALEQGAGLPLTWFEVLAQLGSAPEGSLRMVELSETVLLSKSGVTRLVDRLEAAGLVGRRTCPTDRRVVYATITNEGRAALQRAVPVHAAALQDVLASHLTMAELRTLRGLLEKVIGGNGKMLTNCPSTAELLTAPIAG